MAFRSSVEAFANLMDERLRLHDHDYGPEGWLNGQPELYVAKAAARLERLAEAVERLRSAEGLPAAERRARVRAVHELAADVANYAMMVRENA